MTGMPPFLLLAAWAAFQAPLAPAEPPLSPGTRTAVAEVPLDPAAFARTVDSMEDVVPATRTVARLPFAIDAVSIEFPGSPERLALRPAKGAVEVRAKDQKGMEVVLGAFAWNGPTLEWRWSRVGSARMRDALRDADAALPAVQATVRLVDGSERLVCAPPSRLSVSLKAGHPARLRLAVASGTVLRCEAGPSPDWAPQEPEGDRIAVLTSADGQVTVRHDAPAHAIVVEWLDPVRAEAESLRSAIAEKKREQSRRSGAEQQIVAGEIAALEDRLRALGPPTPAKSVPPVPPLRLVDARGRTLATLTIEAR